MTVQQSFVDDYNQACSEFYQAYEMDAPTEEQAQLLRAWSAAYRRLLFAPVQEDSSTSERRRQPDDQPTKSRS